MNDDARASKAPSERPAERGATNGRRRATALRLGRLHVRPGAWIWLAAVAGFWVATLAAGAAPGETLGSALAAVSDVPWMPLAILGIYAVRAVVLLPSTVLAVVAGYASGPLLGSVVAWLGVLISASVAYGLARWARGSRPSLEADRAAGRAGWRARLHAHAFEAVLIARLAATPGDLVNVVAGASRVPYLPFAAGTVLGGAPGLVAAVLAGASIEGAFRVDEVRVDPVMIVASAGVATLGLAGAWWVRRRVRRSAP